MSDTGQYVSQSQALAELKLLYESDSFSTRYNIAYDNLRAFISTHPDTYTDGAHTTPERCPTCGGDGFINTPEMSQYRGMPVRCPTCRGTGLEA